MTGEDNVRSLVVVGVDGSEHSVAALRWAAGYAAAVGAKVRAVMVWHYQAAPGRAPDDAVAEAAAKETGETMLAELNDTVAEVFAGLSGVPVETLVSYGHPAGVLIEESRRAGLLVVGGSGHGAFTGMMVGSVSIHCVTGADCPVTVVRGR